MPQNALSWFGGSILAVLVYLIVSNMLWLLFGSRLIQFLPGVNIKGFRGTIKIATMLIFSLFGAIRWLSQYILAFVIRSDRKPNFYQVVGETIQAGAKAIHNRLNG